MNTSPKITRMAEDIAAHRREHITDLADVVWYVTEEAEYSPLNESEHEQLVGAVAALVGIEVTR